MNKTMCTNEFNQKGYVKVENAVPDQLRDFVTQYSLFDEMQDFSPDGVQVPEAHAKYADPAMETMLLILQNLVETHTGLSLYPTYSFYRIYRPGDKLEIHKDRPSCEISTTVCFNHSYDSNKYKWPIFMDGNKVDLHAGDMVIYRGCDLAHYRDTFLPGDDSDWHVQGFFHYVNVNGPFADHKFDKREIIGSIQKDKDIKQQKIVKPYLKYV